MRMGVLPQGTFVTPEKRARCSPKGNFRISRREIWCAVGEHLANEGLLDFLVNQVDHLPLGVLNQTFVGGERYRLNLQPLQSLV